MVKNPATGDEKQIFTLDNQLRTNEHFSVYNDYVYFSSNGYMNVPYYRKINGKEYDKLSPIKAGMRYNLGTNTLEYMYSYFIVDIEEGDFGIIVTYRGGRVTEWKTKEEVHEMRRQDYETAKQLQAEGKLEEGNEALGANLRIYYEGLLDEASYYESDSR